MKKTTYIGKPTKKGRANRATKSHRVSRAGQKRVRKSEVGSLNNKVVQKNLGQMVAKTKIKGDVKKYTAISKILSKVAGLPEGRVWSWRYVASVYKDTMRASDKFIEALNAYMKNQDLYKNRRCYFAGRHGVLVAFDTSVMIDVISGCIKSMGYKPVTYSRYMEVKRKAVK